MPPSCSWVEASRQSGSRGGSIRRQCPVHGPDRYVPTAWSGIRPYGSVRDPVTAWSPNTIRLLHRTGPHSLRDFIHDLTQDPAARRLVTHTGSITASSSYFVVVVVYQPSLPNSGSPRKVMVDRTLARSHRSPWHRSWGSIGRDQPHCRDGGDAPVARQAYTCGLHLRGVLTVLSPANVWDP